MSLSNTLTLPMRPSGKPLTTAVICQQFPTPYSPPPLLESETQERDQPAVEVSIVNPVSVYLLTLLIAAATTSAESARHFRQASRNPLLLPRALRRGTAPPPPQLRSQHCYGPARALWCQLRASAERR